MEWLCFLTGSNTPCRECGFRAGAETGPKTARLRSGRVGFVCPRQRRPARLPLPNKNSPPNWAGCFFAWSIDLCGFLSKIDIEMCIFSEANSIEKCEDALSAFVKNENYHVKKAYVLSNTCKITTSGKITYIPINDAMFLGAEAETDSLQLLS